MHDVAMRIEVEHDPAASWPDQPVEQIRGGLAAKVQCGSALVYLGSATDCGSANWTDAPRTELILSSCLGWLKQYENAFLAYLPYVAGQSPRQLRGTLGYRIHRPDPGGYEGQDPVVLFDMNSHALPAVDSLSEPTALELQAYYRNAA